MLLDLQRMDCIEIDDEENDLEMDISSETDKNSNHKIKNKYFKELNLQCKI